MKQDISVRKLSLRQHLLEHGIDTRPKSISYIGGADLIDYKEVGDGSDSRADTEDNDRHWSDR